MILKFNKPGEVQDVEPWDNVGVLLLPNPNYCGVPSGSNYER